MSLPLNASTSAGSHPNPTERKTSLAFLFDRIDYERARNVPYRPQEFRLERMRQLLARLGNPHERLAVVHVAGTKGKGSTAAMIAAVLTASGHRTGLFTSPHLEQIEQRWKVDGRPGAEEETVELLAQIRPAVEQMDRWAATAGPDEIGPTYFEITTAMALLHFVRQKVDAAVLEVGLGGRLDSTNVCRPCVSVITSISLDHTRQLGTTLESIAHEKAGIVKPGVPVVSGVVDPGPRDVIRQVCRCQGSRLIERGTDFDFRYEPPRQLERYEAAGKLDFKMTTPQRTCEHRNLALGLLGRHQAANAAVALAVLDELCRAGWRIPQEAVRAGLARVSLPARLELLQRRPAVLLDVAHNVASVDALLDVLDESFSAGRRWLIFAATEEKDVRGMLARLLPRFDEVVVTRYLNNPRGVPTGDLQRLAAELTGHRLPGFARPADAWRHVRERVSCEDLVCVTGSFFLAAELRGEIARCPA